MKIYHVVELYPHEGDYSYGYFLNKEEAETLKIKLENTEGEIIGTLYMQEIEVQE